jgi:hypothetical protein
VQYPAGQESQAKAIAAAVPGAVAVRTSAVTGVTLVLGTDGKTAKPASEPSATASKPASTGSGSKPSKQATKEPAPKSTDVHNYGTEGTCIN